MKKMTSGRSMAVLGRAMVLATLAWLLMLPNAYAEKLTDSQSAKTKTESVQKPVDQQYKQDLTPKPYNRMNAGDRFSPPVCGGVDLIITKVELRRMSSGIAIKASVKNICSETCRGDIVISVDERGVGPGGSVVTQPIASEVPGETEITMFSWLGVYTRDGVDCTYTVSVSAEGECRETNTANNSCRATLRAGESSKIERCP